MSQARCCVPMQIAPPGPRTALVSGSGSFFSMPTLGRWVREPYFPKPSRKGEAREPALPSPYPQLTATRAGRQLSEMLCLASPSRRCRTFG